MAEHKLNNIRDNLSKNYMKKQNIVNLYLSSKKINNCYDVAQKIKKMGLESLITENYSISNLNQKYNIEKGCIIRIFNIQNKEIKYKLWKPLQKEYNLNCANIEIKDKYYGCILNFFKTTYSLE